MLEADRVRQVVKWTWEEAAVPVLASYTGIEALSPAFDPDWEAHGALRQAADLLFEWAVNRPLEGLRARVVAPPGTTPLLVVEVDGSGAPVLLYGHLDKQPPLGTWAQGLHPFRARRRGERLFGRGTADDGYALFAAMVAMEAVVAAGASLPPCVVVIEASEESGSPDLAAHLERLELEAPSLVVCLDSGALTYDRLWRTTSLRGAIGATVTVEVLTEGLHSGLAGGVVPSSFRILRQLLSRIEDEETGDVLLDEARAELPPALELPPGVDDVGTWPTVPGLRLAGRDAPERLSRQAFSAALEVTGLAGAPAPSEAGNVLRPSTSARVSLRLPPTADAPAAARALARRLADDPPHGARVTVTSEEPVPGWVAPACEPWLDEVVDQASRRYFGHGAARLGVGGSIPFLPALEARFHDAQFLATGVLGPESNAHGPNESLHLPAAKALTGCLAEVLAEAARRPA